MMRVKVVRPIPGYAYFGGEIISLPHDKNLDKLIESKHVELHDNEDNNKQRTPSELGGKVQTKRKNHR